MAELKNKVQNALAEARILILGTQVLIGFGFRAVFEEGFPELPVTSQHLMPEQSEGKTGIDARIGHVLTETRVILPGAQALLGFQFATILMRTFDELPTSSKLVHLASLALVTLSVILLLAPAAYHRIVERGEETERFHRFASRMLLLSVIPLALGLAGDLYVVVRKVLDSVPVALATAGVCLAVCYGLWFGFTLARRARPSSRPRLPGSSRPAHA